MLTSPREVTTHKLRHTLMVSTCIGTFVDARLSAVSFHSVMTSGTGDGILANITLDAITDLDVCKKHLCVHFNDLYRVTSDQTDTIRLFINVSESLAEEARIYLESLFGKMVVLNGGRHDMTLIRMKMKDVGEILN